MLCIKQTLNYIFFFIQSVYSKLSCGKPKYRHYLHSPHRPIRQAPFKQWSEDNLKLACRAVVDHGWTIRKASEEFGVPRSTLFDRVNGRIQFGARSGPARYLSDQEEKELVRFLMGCAKLGFARTRKQVLALVRVAVARKRGKDPDEVCVTMGWWNSFRKRHPQLTVRSASRLAYNRAVAQDPEIIVRYFDLLEETLRENGLLNESTRIFNCDESGFPLDHKPAKVISQRGLKDLGVATSGDKAQLTLLACVSAAGYVLPPLIIFDRKRLKAEHTEGEIPGTLYGLSKNGWIDSEIFEEWFERLFLTHIPPVRPVLLLLDGHSSHYQPSVIRKAANNGVVVFCLPPHTTHISQPLDKTCFSPLKAAWHQECHLYMVNNPGKLINRYNFNQLFSRAWSKAMNPSTVISGFRSTGVCPFDKHAIKLPNVDEEEEEDLDDLSEETGLAFIPLLSPAPRKRHSQVTSPPRFSSPLSLMYSPAGMVFTKDEMEHFKLRWDSGYHLKHDQRYNQWVEIYHPDHSMRPRRDDHESFPPFPGYSSETPPVAQSSPVSSEGENPTSILSSLLVLPDAPSKIRKEKKGGIARVLTSKENLELLETKEREKREKEEEKKKRKEIRERKAQERKEKEKQQKEKRECKAREKEEREKQQKKIQGRKARKKEESQQDQKLENEEMRAKPPEEPVHTSKMHVQVPGNQT